MEIPSDEHDDHINQKRQYNEVNEGFCDCMMKYETTISDKPTNGYLYTRVK